MQPVGCIRPRRKKPKDYVGYEYPIFMRAKAPPHDIYDSVGTLVTPMLGHLVISYRPVPTWAEKDYIDAGFSDYVLATNHPIYGPADLRRYEIATVDSPIWEIKLDLSKEDKVKAGPVIRPAYQSLAIGLGLEPKWLDKVEAIWHRTKVEGVLPDDNDDFVDEVYELLDRQYDEEDAEQLAASAEPDSDAETVVASTSGEALSTIAQSAVESVSTLLSDLLQPALVVTYPTPTEEKEMVPPDIGTTSVEPQLRGKIKGNSVPSSLTGEDQKPTGKALFKLALQALFEGELNSEPRKGPDKRGRVTGHRRGKSLDTQRDTLSVVSGSSSTDKLGGDRNPQKPERRKSFEKAAARLANIPRTRLGKEKT